MNYTIRPDLQYPAIRDVEAFPSEQNGEQVICLRDPQNIAKNMLAVPLGVFYILSLFDGRHSIADIQSEMQGQFGELIPAKNIEAIIQQLDRELFLDSETFKNAMRELEQHFRALPNRPPAFAGKAYAGEAEQLRAELDGYCQKMKAESNGEFRTNASGSVQALVSPHIDLNRGGVCFAYAYEELKSAEPADVYLVFGTGHQIRRSLIVGTRKTYDTPLGSVETDVDFVNQFAENAAGDIFAEELLHRDEHSIEFQALWLRYTLGSEWKGKMIPILCGSLHSYIREGISPRSDKNLAHNLDTLRRLIDEYPGKVCVIAGADMSHVGKRFGSELGIPDSELQRVEKEDHDVLAAMESGNAEAFFTSIEKQQDRNNVCGLSPVYMTLDISRPASGKVLKYDRAIETETESVVTYASVSYRQ